MANFRMVALYMAAVLGVSQLIAVSHATEPEVANNNHSSLDPPDIAPLKLSGQPVLGKAVEYTCKVTKGAQPIDIEWKLNGTSISRLNSSNIITNRISHYISMVMFFELLESHSGVLSCSASNRFGKAEQFAHINVFVPLEWIELSPNSTVALGSEHVLKCKANGNPSAVYTWRKLLNSSKLPLRNDDKYFVDKDYGILIIKSIQTNDHQAIYECKATSPLGSIETRIHLSVSNPVSITNKKWDTVVFGEGSNATLSCLVSGDGPVKVLWDKPSGTINNDAEKYNETLSHQNSTYVSAYLTIFNVSANDEGLYNCTVVNSYGVDKKNIYLKIKEKPVAPSNFVVEQVTSRSFVLKRLVSNSLNDTEDAKLLIQVKSKDIYEELTASWTESKNHTYPGNTTLIVLKDLRPATIYNFRMFTMNQYGVSLPTSPFEIVTLEEKPIGSPEHLSGAATGPNSAKIQWKPVAPTKRNGEIKGYIINAIQDIHHQNNQSLLLTHYIGAENNWNVTVQNKELELRSLRPNSNYSVSIRAYNNVGTGPPSQYIYFRTPEGVPEAPPTNFECNAHNSTCIKCRWDPPTFHLLNGQVIGYKIIYAVMEGDQKEEHPRFKITNKTETAIMNLEVYKNYSIRILALTSAGNGSISDNIICRTGEGTPDEPKRVKVLPSGRKSVTVVFEPSKNKFGIIIYYTIYAQNSETNGNLQIKRVGKEAMQYGEYIVEFKDLKPGALYVIWVTAATGAGEGKPSKTESVVVKQPTGPRIASLPVVKRVSAGSDVIFPCHLISRVQAVETWYKDNRKIFHAAEEGRLQIFDVSEEDEAKYICEVTLGDQMDMIEHHLMIKRRPSKFFLTPGNVTYTTAELLFITMGDKNAHIAFCLQWRPHLGNWIESCDIGKNERSRLVTKLKCGSTTEFRLAGVYKEGKGAFSPVLSIRTKGDIPKIPTAKKILMINGTTVRINLDRITDEGCQIYQDKITVMHTSMNKNTSKELWLPMRKIYIEGKDGTRQVARQLEIQKEGTTKIRITAENSVGKVTEIFLVERRNNVVKILESQLELENSGKPQTSKHIDPVVVIIVICALAVAIGLLIPAIQWSGMLDNARLCNTQQEVTEVLSQAHSPINLQSQSLETSSQTQSYNLQSQSEQPSPRLPSTSTQSQPVPRVNTSILQQEKDEKTLQVQSSHGMESIHGPILRPNKKSILKSSPGNRVSFV